MAGDDEAAEKQRRIEAKRAYSRRLSALKRQQVKDEIAALAVKLKCKRTAAISWNRKTLNCDPKRIKTWTSVFNS